MINSIDPHNINEERKKVPPVNPPETKPSEFTPEKPPTPSETKAEGVWYTERRGINLGRLFMGTLAVLVGLFYLGRNIGFVPSELTLNFALFWPVIIIFIGLSFFRVRETPWLFVGIIITLAILVLVAAAAFLGGINGGRAEGAVEKIPIDITRESSTKSAVINMKTGAGSVKIRGGAGNLAEGQLTTNFMQLTKRSSVSGDVQTVDLETSGSRQWQWPSGIGSFVNDLELRLNSETPIKFFMNSGASDVALDFSQVMVGESTLDIGASSLDITQGDAVSNSTIDIKAGASSIKIHLPSTLGARVELESGLSSQNLDRFHQLDSRTYETDNYSSSDKKVLIRANLGVSNLDIDWR